MTPFGKFPRLGRARAGAAPALLMWTYAKSAKARNLLRDPRCAFVVETGQLDHELRAALGRGAAEIGMALRSRQTIDETDVVGAPQTPEEVHAQAQKRVALVLRLDRVHAWHHGKLPRR
jgi:hypothetical protein